MLNIQSTIQERIIIGEIIILILILILNINQKGEDINGKNIFHQNIFLFKYFSI